MVQGETARLSTLPSSCCSQYFSFNKKGCKRVRTVWILVLVLLVGRYILHVGYKFYSLNTHEPEVLQFRIVTGWQQIKSGPNLDFHTSKDAVDFQYKQLTEPTGDDKEEFICDRSHHRTDVCQIMGDVRVQGNLRSILLYTSENISKPEKETIRPYTRKWETSVTATIDEISLKKVGNLRQGDMCKCDVNHSVPAVVFSTGGYTGNVYHEFNDGLIPLFITSQHLKGEVVFLILEYHNWWMMKYGEVIRQLSRYEVLDFNKDKRVHCFPQVTVGLRIHDELTVDPKQTPGSASIKDFQKLLSNAFLPRIKPMNAVSNNDGSLEGKESARSLSNPIVVPGRRPKLVIIARHRSRVLLNQKELVKLARNVGFNVEVLTPNRKTEMSEMYTVLNACDVMIGVHGAAMTHILFMRRGSIFIQIVPLGTDWAATTYYGEPAMKAGLQYIGYKIKPEESSLSEKYARDDPVLNDPESINSKGWWETKRVYLEGQDVRLSLRRFQTTLKEAYQLSIRRTAALY